MDIPVLKKQAKRIEKDTEGLDKLIENMWETMYNAKGIGLAAPQVGKQMRLFLVDTQQIEREEGEGEGIKKVFINPEILEKLGEEWAFEEGCLSIPDVTGDVERPPVVRIKYQDEEFEEKEELLSGIDARVVQHEYDHVEGILFTELLKPIKKRRIKKRLEAIRKGQIEAKYPVKFAPK